MSLYDVKKIQVASVLKVLPVVFAILGALIGLITFFFFPTDLAAGLGFGAKLLSWVIFVVIYTVIMAVGALVVAWLYNFVTSKLNSSIVISLETKDK
jgi:predicted Co/Zn/Cd cation transporter (cation efflux family)